MKRRLKDRIKDCIRENQQACRAETFGFLISKHAGLKLRSFNQ